MGAGNARGAQAASGGPTGWPWSLVRTRRTLATLSHAHRPRTRHCGHGRRRGSRMIVEVTDPRDPLLADFVALTDVALRRRFEPEHGLFIAESSKVIRRAVAAGYRLRSL